MELLLPLAIALLSGAIYVVSMRSLGREREQLYELLNDQAKTFSSERARLLDRIQAPEVASVSIGEELPPARHRSEEDEIQAARRAVEDVDAQLRARGIT